MLRGARRFGLSAVFWVMGLGMVTGCHNGAAPHPDFVGTDGRTLVVDESRDQQARLQVFCCFDPLLSSHAAMRITGPIEEGRQDMVWDPGGGYGYEVASVGRHQDLIVRGSPTLAEWIEWRMEGCTEPYTLIFEFDLTEAQSQRLGMILLRGARGPDDKSQEWFEPGTPGGGCSLRLTKFLRTFAVEETGFTGRWFWPHKLAEDLWECEPDRVIRATDEGEVVVYTRKPSTPVSMK